jgi:uncharacterized pyridoxamine 5'-phosphate oxidase family protein
MNKNADGAINFRGFLLGNPYVDPFSNQVAAYEKFYQNGLLSKPTYDKWKKSCGISLDTYDRKVSFIPLQVFIQYGIRISYNEL